MKFAPRRNPCRFHDAYNHASLLVFSVLKAYIHIIPQKEDGVKTPHLLLISKLLNKGAGLILCDRSGKIIFGGEIKHLFIKHNTSYFFHMTEAEKYVREYLDYLSVERGRAKKTRENYERYLSLFLKETRTNFLKDIKEESVRSFRVWLARKNIKKNTQSYYVIAIRNFLKYLVKRGIRVISPETIELPKTSRRDIEVLEYDELERLLASPQSDTIRDLRDRAILETLFSTGLRLSELCNLGRYIDLERGEVSVRGKGDKLRVVFLSEGAKSAIAKYLKKRTDTDDFLFVSLDKSGKAIGKITPRSVQRLIEARARKAGIPKKVHPHQIRHSFATDLLINGADLRSVQSLLGHANVSTTQIYTHLTNKELRETHQAFHGTRRRKR